MDNSTLPPRRRGWLRRWTLRLLATAGVIVLVAAGAGVVLYTQARTSNVGDLSFGNELKIPPLLEPTVDEKGRRHFDLTLQRGTSELLAGKRTSTWGVNGSYLGPTLRASRGDKVSIDVGNELPETSTLHWHGMRLPARMDGGPHQMIEPGKTWSPHWTVDQSAATLWYHPHLHGKTAEHVYRGVSGLFLLDDDESAGLALPDEYGVDDIPVVVQDRAFGEDGELEFEDADFGGAFGRMGDEILVNGTHDPHLKVTTKRVRLRVLNASNARSYNVGFADGRSFQHIATDSGLLETPYAADRIRLSPGERAELVAEFTPGESVVLRSFAPGKGGSFPMARFAGADDEFDLMKIVAADRLSGSPEVPGQLASGTRITPPEDAKVRKFTMSGTSKINRKRMDMNRVDEVVPAGATEIWEVRNPGMPHSFHIHEVSFRVLDIDGVRPPRPLRGLKDTVYLPPGSTVRLAVRFGEHTDPETPYMYHCHVLEHEDKGMMGQFVIVEPGTEDEAGTTLGGAHVGHN